MKTKYGVLAGLFLAGLFLISSSKLHAQYENGSLVGTIHDSSGAVVSGATVSVNNTATGITGKTTTTGEGDYEFPSLRTGVYTIAATVKGFAQAVAENITISVGSRQRIDLRLAPGQTETTVEVSEIGRA